MFFQVFPILSGQSMVGLSSQIHPKIMRNNVLFPVFYVSLNPEIDVFIEKSISQSKKNIGNFDDL